MVTKSNSLISVYDCSTAKEIRVFEVPNVVAAALSPKGTYLQTFQKPSGPQEKNVTLWSIETGAAVYQQSQKNMTKANWCVIISLFVETKVFLVLTKFMLLVNMTLLLFR